MPSFGFLQAPGGESRGMATFAVVWAGQVVSVLGSNLTGFALAVWVYQQTGSATLYALITLVTTLPGMLILPLAGALVDRWDRRWAMVLSDSGAAAATLALALLIWRGRLELWHIYVLMSLISLVGAFRWPAFTAATTLLVPRRHLGRAGGMTQLGEAAAQILAPLLAGVMIVTIGRQGVVLLDFASYLVAIAALLAVHMPRPPRTREGAALRGSLRREAAAGWTYIRQRPGLLAVLVLFAVTNFATGLVQVLLPPMVLSFASPVVLGRVLTVAGCGMLAGSLAMSAWGGPRRRVAGILGLLLAQGLILPVGSLRASALLIGAAAFLFMCTVPMIGALSQALWQSKVAADVQGRVFAVRRMVAWSTLPLAYLVAGPLADRVLGPLLVGGGALAPTVGAVLGTGKGRGIALLFILLGVLITAVVAAASRLPRLTRLESELPDAVPASEPPREALSPAPA